MLYREFCDTCGSFILEYGVGSLLLSSFTFSSIVQTRSTQAYYIWFIIYTVKRLLTGLFLIKYIGSSGWEISIHCCRNTRWAWFLASQGRILLQIPSQMDAGDTRYIYTVYDSILSSSSSASFFFFFFLMVNQTLFHTIVILKDTRGISQADDQRITWLSCGPRSRSWWSLTLSPRQDLVSYYGRLESISNAFSLSAYYWYTLITVGIQFIQKLYIGWTFESPMYGFARQDLAVRLKLRNLLSSLSDWQKLGEEIYICYL